MRDRYLFSADRKSSEYRSLLEITPGRARLLTPSKSSRRTRWFVSIVLAFAFYVVWAWMLAPTLLVVGLTGTALAIAWTLLIAIAVLEFAALLAILLWWDRRSLPILGHDYAQSLDLVLLGARSLGTFQDVRARTPSGEEIHLVVDARAPEFWEAAELLRRGPVPST